MLEKEKILSKFNVTDYNTKLEEILERKNFSEEAENLLLNMFYKLESCYKDYEIVKHDNTTEKEFIDNLMNIIDKNCDKIIVIKPTIGKSTFKYKINKKEKTIEVFPNEFNLLYALYKVGGIFIRKEDEISFISKCMLIIFNNGQAMNNSEVIRDFTGWAWDIAVNEIENIETNIFYQNMIFLLGKDFMEASLSNREIDRILEEKFFYIFGKEQGKIAIKKMEQCLISIYSNLSAIKKKNVLFQIEKIHNKLEQLQDREKFIENIKEINDKKIRKTRKIERILSDIELTRKAFAKRNDSLLQDEKIFSISDFIQDLEMEKQKALETINENNNLINPLNYNRKLNDVKYELKKYQELKLTKNTNADMDKYLIDFQKIFFYGMSNKIKNANNKKELIDLIYEIRYYNYLPYRKGVKLRFDKRIEDAWEDVCIELVEKLLDNNIIDVMAEDGKLNYDIVKYIFLTKIVKIEGINIKMTKYNDKIEIEYFDANMMEDKIEIELKDAKNVKIKSERKVKLFI